MTAMGNLFAAVPPGTAGEFVEELLATRTFRIERIVSRGEASPPGFWYDQPEDEWVLLLAGGAVLRLADGPRVTLKPGDHLLIPRRCRHRVDWTDPETQTVWLAVHFTAAATAPDDPPAAASPPGIGKGGGD